MAEMVQEKVHVFYSPHKILFGLNVVRSLGSEVVSLGGRKPLVVTDPGVVEAGLLEPVTKSLEEASVSYVVFDGVEPEPPARLVDEGTEIFKQEGCDLVVGVGGGSSMDVAKGISVMATNEGSVLDFCGFDLLKRRGVPKILVPTTAGTGSEVTRVFVITDEAQNTKKAVYSHYVLAEVGLVDPLLTLSMPKKVTVDTGLDALVHAVETYVSANATPFSDILAERAIEWIAKYLPMAWAKGSNFTARYYMSLASTVAGMAFASGGLGAVHGLCYPLGTEYHMSHGRSNAIMLPHVMKFNIPGNPEKFARIAFLMGMDVEGLSQLEAAHAAVEAVEQLLDSLQVPYHLRDYGIPESDLPKLVAGGMKQTRLFVPNPRDLNEEDVKAIFREAY
ncbi:MAG: iron-containing alcohol dehydrogenase [Thermodesulfobacteriota bacterium]